jgi:hypothetical protein
MKYLLALLLLASPALAQDRQPTTTEQCQAILNAFGSIQISAAQSKVAADVQAGIVQVCQKLIKAEEPKPEPTPEPAK